MRRIGSWVVGLDDTYATRDDDGDLVLYKPGRTLFTAPFAKAAATGTARAHLERILVGAPSTRRTVLEREEDGLLRHAYLVRERQDDGHRCWVLASWTFAGDAAAIGLSFYFDLKRDLEWAVAAAESVRFGEDEVTDDVRDGVGESGHTALASPLVAGADDRPVLLAICEAFDGAEDSGWRFFARDERGEGEVVRCALTRFVARDPGLGDLIAEEDTGAWRRAAVGAPWQRVE